MRDNQERRKDLRRDNAQRRPFAAAEERDDADNILEGRNALTEALASGRAIDKVFIAEGNTDRALARLAAQARQSGAVVVETDRRKLDQMSATGAHQGIIAMVAAHSYATVDDILALARERGEAPLIVVCDELSDPHNLGAIIRTAECAGAHGVIIPKRRSVGLTAVVGKASAGALEYMPVARVSNVTADGRRPQRPRRHRDRKRGRGHEPPRGGKLRFQGQHPDEGKNFFTQCLGGGSHFAV